MTEQNIRINISVSGVEAKDFDKLLWLEQKWAKELEEAGYIVTYHFDASKYADDAEENV